MNTKSTIKRGGASALAILTFVTFLLSAQPASAGLMSQTDTNVLTAFSTNTFLLYNDITGSFTNGEQTAGNQFIDGSKSDDLICAVGGFFTNSVAGSSNVIFRIAGSVDLANWTNNAQTITLAIPANTTNWVHAQFVIQNASPGYGLRAVENVNTGNVSAKAGTLYFKAYSKNGI